FTLSSRQRIIVRREIARLKSTGSDERLLKELERDYRYAGEETCAGDGLCSMSCPVGINTGDLTHRLRGEHMCPGTLGYAVGDFAANHFSGVKSMLRPVLTMANGVHSMVGTGMMNGVARTAHGLGLPLWTAAMPKAYKPQTKDYCGIDGTVKMKAVYFPSCINQTMGASKGALSEVPLVKKTVSLLAKAGIETVFPADMDKLCCGTIWESKGMEDIADRKTAELEAALWEASEHGRWPVLCDQSPCLHRMRHKIKRMKLYEPVEFIWTFVRPRLAFTPKDATVAVHITCSTRKMGLGDMLVRLAEMCASKVIVPEGVGCCGFAGDKGFTHPEVNAYALRKLRPAIEAAGVTAGYSNSRTCEIGLTTHSGVPYESIVYLVDECTEPI
ncbi:MAG: (Fe-S)-binding protein, partial [Muribaculaceae bacterium]|nr:(Fe-S)-binding protein [Muribaculaceae bacterium]